MTIRRMQFACTVGLLLGAALAAAQPVAAGPAPVETAARIDALLAAENYGGGDQPAELVPRADDETYLRRLSLDLVGTVPTPEQIIAFVFDSAPDKRHRAVEQLLDDGHYGQNWARYWRDVILSRRKDDRALLAAPALVNWLTAELNKNTPWKRIAHDFITATGDVRDVGATAIIMAQTADPSDTTAEMSRILLGIQIQCAQCHNHPSDHWKREQFHELAAFFPRIGIRPDFGGDKRSFAVVSLDRPHQKRVPGDPEEAKLEHFMPDLEHPQHEGKLMKPVLFATGERLETGHTDLERRERLAQWVTAPSERWFARAIVNRMWSELVGQGFYEPVDDMGPDRQPRAGKAFEELTTDFIANGYHLKWLMRTICATEAYQRECRSRHDQQRAPFAANSPQRLRADQLFNVLCDALEIDEQALDRPTPDGARKGMNGPRGTVMRTFGYDPSTRRDEVAGSIPQVLWMMNGRDITHAISGRSSEALLGRLVAEKKDDRMILTELYLRTLSRTPRPAEVELCVAHLASHRDRVAGLEDILWSLVNSTEFLNRR